MAPRTRSTVAALIGAAVVSAAAPSTAASDHQPTTATSDTIATPMVTASADHSTALTLRSVIESRLADAHRARRYADIDQLSTLWMTLRNRDQLDRVVERPQSFVAVALRNQQRSHHRTAKRWARCVPTDDPALTALAGIRGSAWQSCNGSGKPDERLDASELLAGLDEPYRTAVALSAQGLNRREVAAELGVSHAAVRKWMERLRKRVVPSEASES